MLLTTIAQTTPSDLVTYRLLLEPIVQFFTSLMISGVSVAYVVQFLKSSIVPVQFQKYPRLTAAVGSVIATMITLYTTSLNYVFDGPVSIIGFVLGTFIVAGITYRNIIKGSSKAEVPAPAETIKPERRQIPVQYED